MKTLELTIVSKNVGYINSRDGSHIKTIARVDGPHGLLNKQVEIDIEDDTTTLDDVPCVFTISRTGLVHFEFSIDLSCVFKQMVIGKISGYLSPHTMQVVTDHDDDTKEEALTRFKETLNHHEYANHLDSFGTFTFTESFILNL